MAQNDLRLRLDSILAAIAAGRTCEQILAADRTLSYHDIFHAIAEAPTGFWERNVGNEKDNGQTRLANSFKGRLRQRAD